MQTSTIRTSESLQLDQQCRWKLFYCQIAYGEKTEKAALAVADADAADLKTGCSGFSWTALHAAPAD